MRRSDHRASKEWAIVCRAPATGPQILDDADDDRKTNDLGASFS
ncbi:MAG TPA: hypothetical protein VE981_09715 [Planctomycetota bacterium]|nr:hypothetical protein [Planctomycetota bacterium]